MKKLLLFIISISLISIACSKAHIRTIEYNVKENEICISTNGEKFCIDVDPNKIIIR